MVSQDRRHLFVTPWVPRSKKQQANVLNVQGKVWKSVELTFRISWALNVGFHNARFPRRHAYTSLGGWNTGRYVCVCAVCLRYFSPGGGGGVGGWGGCNPTTYLSTWKTTLVAESSHSSRDRKVRIAEQNIAGEKPSASNVTSQACTVI